MGWKLEPLGARILPALLADPPGPMHHLARAANDDALEKLLGGPDRATSTNATVGLSRLMAHEIRNALGPLRAASKQLAEAARPHVEPKRYEKLQIRVDRGLARLETFATEVTQLTRGAGGERVFAVTESIEAALRATLNERNGHLQVERHLVDAEVKGQPARLTHAFTNLIRNAAQAAPSKGATLTISMSTTQGEVSLFFSDDGPGVAEGHLEGLFEVGVSGRGGSGMGLAIVREIVEEEMGGTVAYVRGGAGATFVVRLPRTGGGV